MKSCVTLSSGDLAGGVSTSVLAGPTGADGRQHLSSGPPGVDLGKGKRLLGSRPVHSSVTRDEGVVPVPRHDLGPSLPQPDHASQHRVSYIYCSWMSERSKYIHTSSIKKCHLCVLCLCVIGLI